MNVVFRKEMLLCIAAALDAAAAQDRQVEKLELTRAEAAELYRELYALAYTGAGYPTQDVFLSAGRAVVYGTRCEWPQT